MKNMTFDERWKLLNSLSPDLKICDLKIVNNFNELQQAHTKYVEDGYEGLIIRTMKGIYQPDHRSSSLLKFKSFKDDEFEIVDFKEGKGNDKGTIIFKCKTNAGGEDKFFEVRPRGTREERKEMFENGKDYIGKKITVKYFELTDENIPRFPVGIAIRDYE